MRRVAAAFGVSRSALADAVKRAEAPVAPAEEVQHVPRAAPGDEELLGRIRSQVSERPSYGYRFVTAMLNTDVAAGQRVITSAPTG